MATCYQLLRCLHLCVSIHATLAGGDGETQQSVTLALIVSIHATLAGGDKLGHLLGFTRLTVSIHATLAGGDDYKTDGLADAWAFLSTPPSRVATDNVIPLEKLWEEVSIHATLAGGD